MRCRSLVKVKMCWSGCARIIIRLRFRGACYNQKLRLALLPAWRGPSAILAAGR
jgi:hypothetical protein